MNRPIRRSRRPLYIRRRQREAVAVAWIMAACTVVFSVAAPALLIAGRHIELAGRGDAAGDIYSMGIACVLAAVASAGLALTAVYDRLAR